MIMSLGIVMNARCKAMLYEDPGVWIVTKQKSPMSNLHCWRTNLLH